jgi:hypothetical protein
LTQSLTRVTSLLLQCGVLLLLLLLDLPLCNQQVRQKPDARHLTAAVPPAAVAAAQSPSLQSSASPEA